MPVFTATNTSVKGEKRADTELVFEDQQVALLGLLHCQGDEIEEPRTVPEGAFVTFTSLPARDIRIPCPDCPPAEPPGGEVSQGVDQMARPSRALAAAQENAPAEADCNGPKEILENPEQVPGAIARNFLPAQFDLTLESPGHGTSHFEGRVEAGEPAATAHQVAGKSGEPAPVTDLSEQPITVQQTPEGDRTITESINNFSVVSQRLRGLVNVVIVNVNLSVGFGVLNLKVLRQG